MPLKFRKTAIVILLTALFFSHSAPLKAQQQYKVTSTSVINGLSQSSVFSIAQDKHGFLWIGTQDGLNRFNGITFDIFTNEPFDSMSLPASSINALLVDSKNRLWAGTAMGLSLFLPEKDQFKNFLWENKTNETGIHFINTIREDEHGNIWIGTGDGLYRMNAAELQPDKDNASFEYLPLGEADSASTRVFSMAFTGSRQLLASTSKGILRIELKSSSFKDAVFDTTSVKGIPWYPQDFTQVLEADQQGNIWISDNCTIVIYEIKSGRVKKILPFSADEKIASMTLTSEGEMWISSTKGLYKVAADDVKNVWSRDPVVTHLMAGDKVLNNGMMVMMEDRISRGIVWAGSQANGLIKISPVNKMFLSSHLDDVTEMPIVFSICEDPPFLWLGTTDGIIRYDQSTRQYIKFLANHLDTNSLASNFIGSLYLHDGTLWAGTVAGLQEIIHPRSSKPSFRNHIVNPVRKKAGIRAITRDTSGSLLVAIPQKIFRREKGSNRFQEIIDISRISAGKPNIISSVLQDRHGRYWVGTTGGLAYYKDIHSKAQWYAYDLKDTSGLRNNLIQNISQDSKGNIWISTFNGFTKVTISSDRPIFKNYSTADGLINNTVYGFLEDEPSGQLWISTNGGLSRFDPVQQKFVNFDAHDGLQSNEFNANAFYKNKNGKMYFGGISGYTEFYPSQIKLDTVKPEIVITGIAAPGSEKLNPASGPAGKQIVLPYHQNSLTLEFVSLHYADPLKNKYAYKLEGIYNDWISCGTNRQVNFSQLAPGTYIFRVIGSNADGMYNYAGDSITIVIEPPFWKTIWFYLLIALLVSGILLALHRYRLRMKLQQMREIEKIRRETAADFHDELGHRLTTIHWFSEVMKNKLRPEEKELRSYVDKIIDTSSNLYHTMKDLLWAMDPKKDSMYDLYSQLKQFGEGIFDQTGIDFAATPPPENLKKQELPLIYKRHVLLIMKEVMHNSFKHSHCTKTKLELYRENGNYSILFEDNGTGFNLKKEPTGSGLKNITRRAGIIHAHPEMQSGENGTRLILSFPIPS